MEEAVATAVKALDHSEALEVSCPFCGADVGQPCMVPTEHLPEGVKAKKASSIHEARLMAFVVLTGRDFPS